MYFIKLNYFLSASRKIGSISEKIVGDNTTLNIQMIQLSCTNFIKIYNSLLLLILSKIGFLINFKLLKFYFSEERVFNTKLMKCQNYLVSISWILIPLAAFLATSLQNSSLNISQEFVFPLY